MDTFRKAVIDCLKKTVDVDENLLETPPNPKMGDFAYPCFTLSKTLKKSPAQIAQDLAQKITVTKEIVRVEASGPYLNFFVDNTLYVEKILFRILHDGKTYGAHKSGKKKTIVMEFPSPNTNKPLHLGHVRNMLLGQSISNILEALGHNVMKVNLNNDRGVHICKSMLAYKLYGNNEEPDMKTDHFVGKYYVIFSQKAETNKELEEQALAMLVLWEQGDEETLALWRKMNQWAFEGFHETYKKFGLSFDKEINESDIYKEGKEIVYNAQKKGIVEKDEHGAFFIDLSLHGLGKKYLLRADGTSVYITQDLYLAKLKHDEFSFDQSVYVVGSEQNHHFKVLFKILELMGYTWAKDLYHLSYGMVYLPHGRMKSREGTVVDADDLIGEMQELAQKELERRYPEMESAEKKRRAEKIGMAALRFFVLKFDAAKDFTYNPEESIAFEGETGPYIQYTVARIYSILRKYGKEVPTSVDVTVFLEDDINLCKRLSGLPAVLEQAGLQMKPHLLSRYLLDVALAFNEYYHKHQVLSDDKNLEVARILLISQVKQVLENGLNLLGIDALEEM